jgi:hypothetical protein
MSGQTVIPIERIASCIYLIRDRKVMLDYDLAELYDVPTKALNQAVSRNKNRFPDDFMLAICAQPLETDKIARCALFITLIFRPFQK